MKRLGLTEAIPQAYPENRNAAEVEHRGVVGAVAWRRSPNEVKSYQLRLFAANQPPRERESLRVRVDFARAR